MQYTEVQNIAKKTIEFIKDNIQPGMTLLEVRHLCETKMMELGADSFWYWDVGAFVFAGDETTLSVSGKEYTTSERVIAENDIITIDLSPQNEYTWGDYARTIIIENGKVVETDNVTNDEWKKGLLMEEYLHEEMCKFVAPETTFEELYYHINGIIEEKGPQALLINRAAQLASNGRGCLGERAVHYFVHISKVFNNFSLVSISNLRMV